MVPAEGRANRSGLDPPAGNKGFPCVLRSSPAEQHMTNPEENSSLDVRKGQGREFISKVEFERRYRTLFFDPAFRIEDPKITELMEIAWNAYQDARKSPLTRKAGKDFADANYDLSVEWLATRTAIEKASAEYDSSSKPPRALLICGSARNDKTCPGEMSKSFRLIQTAKDALEARQIGDSAGIEGLRRSLTDWLNDMGLVQAGHAACIDRFIDYYGPYATSHVALDKDEALHEEVRNAARALASQIDSTRKGIATPDEGLSDPRPK
jgi:hypothetical protein